MSENNKIIKLFMLLLSFTVTYASSIKKTPSNDLCSNKQFDLYLITETSAFVGAGNIVHLQNYLKTIVEGLSVSEELTHVSMITFDRLIKERLNLKQGNSKSMVLNSIDKLTASGYGVSARRTMRYAADKIFTPEFGRRQDTPAVCLLFVAYPFLEDYKEAAALLKTKCRLIITGAKYARLIQMFQIASEPSTRHSVFSRRFKDLPRRIDFTMQVLCEPPLVSPRLTKVGFAAESVQVEWNSQPFASYFLTQVTDSLTGGVVDEKRLPSNASTVKFEGLNPRSNYQVQVWPVDDKDKKGPVGRLTIATGIKAPSLEVDLESVTSNSVTIIMDRQIHEHLKYYGVATAIEDETDQTRVAISGSSIQLNGLQAGTRYEFQVQGYKMLKSTDRLEKVTPLILATSPEAPTVQAVSITKKGATLKWNTVASATRYEVVVTSVADGQEWHHNIVETGLILTDLRPSHRYTIDVTAFGYYGLKSKNDNQIKLFTGPANPSTVTLTDVQETEVEISWNEVTDTVEYWIYVELGMAEDREFMKKIVTASTSHRITGLRSGLWYTLTVYSIDEAEILDDNIVNPVRVQTIPEPPLEINGLETSNSIQIDWQVPEGALEYQVFRRNSDGGNFEFYRKVTTPQVLVKNLLPGNKYEFAFKTISETKLLSVMSEEITFTTLPSASKEVTVDEIWTNGASLNWEPAIGAAGYKLVVETEKSDKLEEISLTTTETQAKLNTLEAGKVYNASVYTVGFGDRVNVYERATVIFQTTPEPPKFVQVEIYGSKTLTVVWTKAEGAHGYRMLVSQPDEDDGESDLHMKSYYVVGRNSETLAGLTPVTQYKITVFTINFYNKESGPSNVITEYTLPEQPEKPRVVEVANEMLYLDWNDVSGIERYVVHIEDKKTNKKWDVSTAVSELTLYNLSPGNWYDIQVSSVGINGRMNDQKGRTLSTQTLPSTPTDVKIRRFSTTTVSLTWKKVYGARNYIVYVYDTDTGDVDKRVSVNGVYVTVHVLESGSAYLVEVAAVGQDYMRFGKPSEALEVFTDPYPPKQPNVTSVMSTKIGLQWNEVKGARAYLVEIYGPDSSTELETSTNEILVENLTPGILYNFTIFSIGHMRTNNQASPTLQVYTTPSPPENLQILDMTSVTADVKWDSTEGAAGYLVTVQGLDESGKNSDIFSETFDGLRATIDKNLKPGTFYTVFVQTVAFSGPNSEKKEFVEFMTLPGNPGKPEVESIRIYSATVRWPPAEGAAYYMLNLKRLDDGFVDNIQSEESVATLRFLQAGSDYQVHVESFNAMDGSGLAVSEPLTFRTLPKGVENLQVASVTDDQISLSWSQTSGAELYALEASSKGAVVQTKQVAELESTFSDLSPGEQYVFNIVPIGLNGLRGTVSATITETTIPSKPTPIIQSHGESFIRIGWEKVAGATSYRVITESKDYDKPTSMDVGINTATVGGLNPGTWYSFVVFSVDSKKRQSLSGSAALSALTTPRQVSNIKFSNVGESSFDVEWTGSKGAAVYLLDITTPEGLKEQHTETSETKASFIGLRSGSRLEVEIRIRDDSGRTHSVGSKAAEYTLPEAVAQIELVQVGINDVTLEWEAVRGALKYKLVTTAPEGVRVAETSEAQIKIGSLIPGRFYEFAAYSVGMTGIENPSKSPTLVVQTAPLAPRLITFSDITTNSFTVSWNSVFGSIGYALTATSTDGSENIVVNDLLSTSYSLESLTAGTEYVVTVVTKAQQEGRVSSPSVPATVTTVCLTPDKPQAVDVTTSSVTLEWTPVKGAIRYDIEMSKGDEISTFSSPTSTVTVDSLLSGTRYNFSVFSIGKGDLRNNEGSVPLLIQIAPTAPEELAFTKIGSSFVVLTWQPVGSSTYDVRVIQGDSIVQDLSNRKSPLMIRSLNPGEIYKFTVTSIGDGGFRSDESEIVDQATLPAVVENLNIKSVEESSLSASWLPAAGAETYQLVAKSTVDESDEVVIETTQTNAVLRSLRAGHWYSISVISVGKMLLTNQHSSELSRLQTVSLPPTDIEVDQVTTTTIQLSWREAHGVSFYQLEVNALDERFQSSELKTLRSESDEIVIRNLVPGVSYMIRIVSVNEEGRESAPTPKLYESTHPASATGLNVIDVNSTSVSINWNPVLGANYYHVYLENTETLSKSLVATSTESFASIGGLEAGTNYAFVVFTFDAKNRSSSSGSDALSVQTVPLPPNSISTDGVTTRDVILRWNAMKGAVSYKIRYGLVGDTEALQVINTTETFIHISSLNSGSKYWFAVRSKGSGNQLSESSNMVSESTLPATPTSIDVTASSSSLIFYWEPVKGAIQYDGKLVGENGVVIEAISNASNITFDGLNEGTFYNFTVKSVGESKSNEEYSEVLLTQTAPGKPVGVIVSATTTSSVELQWEKLTGASSYLVMGESDEGDIVGEKEVEGTTATIAGIEPGTQYHFDVQGIGFEDVPGPSSDTITAVTVPSSPAVVSLVSITNQSASLSWKPTQGSDSYKLIGTLLDGSDSVFIETDKLEHTLTGLVPGTFYEFVVLARGVNGILNEVPAGNIRKQTTPSAPTSGFVSNATDTSFIIKWDAAVGAASYMVKLVSAEDEITFPSITETLQVNNLLPGTEYDIFVRSVGEEGQISEENFITTEATYPSGMKDIQAKFVSATKVGLAWDEVEGATSYQVLVKSKEDLSSYELPTRAFVVDETTVEMDELEPGTYYEFRVFSIGLKDRRNIEDSAFIRIQTVTLPPTRLSPSNVQTESAFFTWNKADGAEKYRIHYELELSDLHNTSSVLETKSTSAALNDLEPGSYYWVSVKAVNFQGVSSEGSKAVFITTKPEAVTELSTSRITNSSVTLSWKRPKGAWNFEIRARNMQTEEKSVVTTPSNVHVATDLDAGVKYEFYVTSIGIYEVRNSDKNSFIIAQIAPSAPEGVRATVISNNSISLMWREAYGASSYEVTWYDDENILVGSQTSDFPAITLTSLTPGDQYTIVVESMTEEGVVHRQNQAIKVQTRTDPPAFIQAFKTTETTIQLLWKPANGAQGYLIHVISQDVNEKSQTKKSAKSKIEVDNLQPGVKYDIFVKTIDYSGSTSDQETALVNIQTLPKTPDFFEVLETTTTTIITAWDESVGATKYIFKYGATGDKSDINTIETIFPTAIMENLSPGVEYWMAVKAVGETPDNIGRESEEIVQTTVPETPTNFRVYSISKEAVHLDWDTIRGATGYILTLNAQNSTDIPMEIFNSSVSRYELNTLVAGEVYTVDVKSVGTDDLVNPIASEELFIQTGIRAPEELASREVTTTSFVISWTPVYGALLYEVKVVPMSADSATEMLETTETEVLVEHLDPGTVYYITVQGQGFSNAPGEISKRHMEATLPLPPSNLVVSEVTTDTALIIWQAQKGVTKYNIHLTAEMNFYESTILETTSSNFRVNGLVPGTKYLFAVYSSGTPTDSHNGLNPVGSEVIERQTVAQPPNKLTPSSVKATSMTVSWPAMNGASNYEVELTSGKSGLTETFVLSETETKLAPLDPGTEYSVSVRSINSEDRSSVASEILIQNTLSSSAENVRLLEYGTNSMTLAWDPLPGMDRYKVSVKNVDEDDTVLFDSESTQFSISTLESATLYELVVHAVEDGVVLNDASDKINLLTPPLTPENFKIRAITSSSVALDWDLVSKTSSYELMYGPPRGSKTSKSVDTNSLLLSGLESGTQYSFQVYAVGRQKDKSQPSEVIIDTTDPLSPTTLESQEQGEDFVRLTWIPQKGAYRYVVRYKSPARDLEVSTQRPPFTLHPLEKTTSYEITVSSVGVRGVVADKSDVLKIHTDLLSPKNLKVISVSTDRVNLDWDDFKDSEGYKVYYNTVGSSQKHIVETDYSNVMITSNIVAGSRYQFTVTSIGEVESQPSEVLEVLTLINSPTIVESFNEETEQVGLTWNAVDGAASYKVQITTSDDEIVDELIVQKELAVVTNLQPGTLYNVQIASTDSLGRQSPDWSPNFTFTTIPRIATQLRVLEVSTDFMELTWNPADGAISYEVEVSTAKKSFNILLETDSAFARINNLNPGEEVEIRVLSKAFDKRSQPSGSIRQRTILPPPTGFVVKTINYTAIALTWNAIPEAKSYTIYVNGQSSSSPKKSLSQSNWRIEGITKTSHIVSDLEPANLYSFQVSAKNEDDIDGLLSVPVSAVTGEIELVEQGLSWLSIKWPQIPVAYTYIITWMWIDEMNVLKETVTQVENIDLVFIEDAVIRNITGLLPNTEYSFNIRANGVFGESTVMEDFSAVTLPLSPPRNVRTSEVRAEHIIATWDEDPFATTYYVIVRLLSSNKIIFEKIVEENSVFIDGLKTYENYALTVQSSAYGGHSKSSYPLEIQPRHPTPVLPLGAAPELVSKSPSSITVQLPAVEFAESYRLQVDDDSGKMIEWKTIEEENMDDEVLIENLKDNFFYQISYFAVGFGGDMSDTSEYLTVSTDRLMPDPPQNVAVINKDAGSIVLAFDTVENAVSYSVSVTNRYKGTLQTYRDVTSPFKVSSLKPGEAYLIKINSHSKYGDTVPSDILSVEVPFPTGGVVRSARPTRVTPTGFRLQWSPTPYTSSYTLSLAIGANPILEVRNVPSNQYNFNDLKPSTSYQVKVLAIGRDGSVMSSGNWVQIKTSSAGTVVGSDLTNKKALISQFLSAVTMTTDTAQRSALELQRYKGRVEDKIKQLHLYYDDFANTDNYRLDTIRRLNALGISLKPLIQGDVIKSLAELDEISEEISSLLLSITKLNDTLPVNQQNDLKELLRNSLRDLVAERGLSYVDALESFGKHNKNLGMTFTMVTSHGFRVSWLRYRTSYRYLVTLIERSNGTEVMVHNKTHLSTSTSFDYLVPDTEYKVKVTPLAANGDLIEERTSESSVFTNMQTHKLLADISSLGSRHIILGWKVWPMDLTGVTFTVYNNGKLLQSKVVTRKASHRVVMFVGLTPQTEYQLEGISNTGELVYNAKATTKLLKELRVLNDEKENIVLPPSDIKAVNSSSNTVKISWDPPDVGNFYSQYYYSVGLYRPGKMLLVKLVRKTYLNEVTFTNVESGVYDVRIRTHNNISPGKQSPYSNPLRVVVP